jgi:hypothetical protein
VGIDEAGYGPLLGPLVIGATLWQVPPEQVNADWWDSLTDCLCRAGGRGEARLPVGDSKQTFDRKRGLWTLERTVLAFAQAAGLRPRTVGELLAKLGYEARPAVAAFPWYRDLSAHLPVDGGRSVFEGAAGRLEASMAASGIHCCGLSAEVVTEDVFNRRIAQTRNKATLPLEAVLRRICWAAQGCRGQDLHVLVDRLGGRTDYRRLLMQAFPTRHLHVLEVSDECSRYRLGDQDSDWYVQFAVAGDQRYLPVALASMLAKYLRELLMERFNAYWRGLSPDLRPTAGYYRDAQRFLADIQPLVARASVRPEAFIRLR